MKYAVAMLSCGRPDYVRRTLAAYREFLTPAPSSLIVYDDGGQTPLDAFDAWPKVPVRVESLPYRLGRCAAHAQLWKLAAESKASWIWTVEDDILLLRPLDLHDLAELLNVERDLAQLALVRCPWGAEIPHGGYIPMRGEGWYERRGTKRHPWIASTLDWTSSPALLRVSLPRKVEWPAEPGCEGTLGDAIRAVYPRAVSGYWGHGEAWCSHIGMERVEGGHGY